MSETADIIVIGGGIAGVSAAAELSRDARVILLEAERNLGYHSTGRSAAIFIRNYGNATLKALNAMAYPALAGELLGETVLSPRGELLLAKDDELDKLDAYIAESTGVDRLTPDEAHELVPALRKPMIAGALIERDAQNIDVDRLLQGNARLLRARGGIVEQGRRVAEMSRRDGLWRIATEHETFEAPVVVNAAGAWADRLAALAGVRGIGLQPMRRSAVIMAVPDRFEGLRGWPLFGSISENWYAKPDGDRLMISPADEDPVDPHDAWPDDMVLAEGLFRFEEMVDIPVVRPSHSWAGLRSFVPDRTPVAGFAPDAPGFFWLAGQGGYGVQTSPALAALTRRLVIGGGNDAAEDPLLRALSPARLPGMAG